MVAPITKFWNEYRWLSNFHRCHIKYLGLSFNNVEEAYQAAKCTDSVEQKEFVGIGPLEAKHKGNRCRSFRPDWDSVRVSVMRELLRCKFYYNDDLCDLLLATGDADLVEGNHWGDQFWGVCKGEGQNMLGKLLMEVREQLRFG